MHRRYITILAVLTCIVSWAITPREEFARDKRRSAYCYVVYPDKDLPALTPAPRGYVPFHIDHYGRHGSRWLTSAKAYSDPIEILDMGARNGRLTARGQETLSQLKVLNEASQNRWGELTPLGAEQHRGIAERMMTNFPQVFAGDAIINARSTTKIRCILSMSNELQVFSARNPLITIDCDASAADMHYLKSEPRELIDSLVKPAMSQLLDLMKAEIDFSHFHSQLFNDPQFVADSIAPADLVGKMYELASNMQSHSEMNMSFYDLFTVDELYGIWNKFNTWNYVYLAACPQSGSACPYVTGVPLLRNIIASCDAAIASGNHGATLRFGHDTVIMPTVCLMGLDWYGAQVSDMSKVSDEWQNYRIFPMAANLQMVFYRHAKGKTDSADILVKFLYNEHEATLPISAVEGPYYRWNDVKSYFENILAMSPYKALGY